MPGKIQGQSIRGVEARRSTEGVRPAPLRDGGELSVVWRTVEMLERHEGRADGVGMLKERPVPGWGTAQSPVNARFRDEPAPQLKDFLDFGKSSLTPYEATQLGMGLGFGGTWHIETSEKARPYQRGDRVSFELTGADGKTSPGCGIAVQGGILTTRGGNNDFTLLYPEALRGLKNIKVLSGALNDGKLERSGG